jgi:hypothetical protein
MFPEDKGGRYVGLTTLPPSCVDCLAVWGLQPPKTVRDSSGITGIALPVFIGRRREVPEEWTELCTAF